VIVFFLSYNQFRTIESLLAGWVPSDHNTRWRLFELDLFSQEQDAKYLFLFFLRKFLIDRHDVRV
jgi:hypothetical protein